jgi:hypothetical protein
MKTLAVGTSRAFLAVLLVAVIALSGCSAVGRSVDVATQNLPSGIARPSTVTATALTLAVVPTPIEVTRASSEPPALSTVAAAASATEVAGFPLLVLHTNDVRGYSLPCG